MYNIGHIGDIDGSGTQLCHQTQSETTMTSHTGRAAAMASYTGHTASLQAEMSGQGYENVSQGTLLVNGRDEPYLRSANDGKHVASLAAKRNEAVPNDNALASQAAALVDIDNPILKEQLNCQSLLRLWRTGTDRLIYESHEDGDIDVSASIMKGTKVLTLGAGG